MSQAPQMRRAERAMPEEHAWQMLATGFYGRLGTAGADGWPYVVPLLCVWMNRQVYVHHARARGHLRSNLDANRRVCFEIDAPSDVFAYGRYECDTGLAYQSVIAFGTMRLVDEPAEKTSFCVELMRKYADPSWQRPKDFFPRLGDITVWALAIERLTGKEQALPAASQRWPAVDRTKSPSAIPPPPLR